MFETKDFATTLLEERYPVLAESPAPFSKCPHYTCDDNRVMVMSVGGSSDPLDRANGVALEELAEAWEVWTDNAGEGNTSDNAITVHHGFYNWTYVCIDPSEVHPDILDDIIHTTEAYADYPVLDESLMSGYELEDFTECFGDGVADIEYRDEITISSDHKHRAWGYAMEHFYGYSDPGYIADEDIQKSLDETREVN